jgi:hypothetical protein
MVFLLEDQIIFFPIYDTSYWHGCIKTCETLCTRPHLRKYSSRTFALVTLI